MQVLKLFQAPTQNLDTNYDCPGHYPFTLSAIKLNLAQRFLSFQPLLSLPAHNSFQFREFRSLHIFFLTK